MTFENILVPFDGSDHAKRAFDLARRLLEENADARLTLINVIPLQTFEADASSATLLGESLGVPQQFLTAENYRAYVEESHERARRAIVESIGEQPEARSRIAIEAVADTSPAHGICDYAAQHGCDLIVMGRRGLGALRGALGSVSFAVLRETDIPVLTVK